MKSVALKDFSAASFSGMGIFGTSLCAGLNTIRLRSFGEDRIQILASSLSCHEIAEFNLICLRPESASTDMLQETETVSPFARVRDRMFEVGFFSLAMIAMAGWLYFITLLLVRLSLWCFG
jgi:hypothetical protein